MFTKTYHFRSSFYLKTPNNKKITVHITGSPESTSIEEFSRLMKDKAITDIFCFCEPKYNQELLKKQKINCHNLIFQDGQIPPAEILILFDKILNNLLRNNEIIINMHCVAGLGRAPTMLGYLMIRHCGLNELDTVKQIRQKIKGAINSKQLEWLQRENFNKNNLTCNIM
jgi:protein tyrosine phosphatase type 4A